MKKLVIWKNETYRFEDEEACWEYENDPDWYMTISLSKIIDAGQKLVGKGYSVLDGSPELDEWRKVTGTLKGSSYLKSEEREFEVGRASNICDEEGHTFPCSCHCHQAYQRGLERAAEIADTRGWKYLTDKATRYAEGMRDGADLIAIEIRSQKRWNEQ